MARITIEDCLELGYFGFGPNHAQYDPNQSQTGRINWGTLILVASENGSGLQFQFNAILLSGQFPDGTIWTLPYTPFQATVPP